METIKILHSADWHLSNRMTIAGRFVLSQGINLALLDRVQALKKIIEYAQKNDADLIVIPGDIFDHHDPEDVAVDVAVSTIESLSEQAPVVIVKGNHEGGKASEVSNALASLKQRPGIFLFEEPGMLPILIKDRHINIFALPYPKKPSPKSDPSLRELSPEEISVFVSRKMEEVLTGFQTKIEKDAINVLVGHFTVAGSIYSKEQSVPPFDISVRKEFLEPFDVVCLGHLHEPQEYYSGAIARSGFGEQDMKVGFKVHEVQESSRQKAECSVKTEFIELPARQYETISPDEFLQGISQGFHYQNGVAVRIKGKLPKFEYDEVMRKIKAENLQFFKNSLEVESDTAGGNGSGDVSEEPSLEEAIKLWAVNREGVGKFMDQLIVAAKEIEAKFSEAR